VPVLVDLEHARLQLYAVASKESAMPPAGTTFAIAAATVFDGERCLQDHCVIVHEETVTQVLPTRDCPSNLKVLRLEQGTLAPGFIDLQVNGGGGIMLNNDPSCDAVNTISRAHHAAGTTSILPTLLSDTREVQQAAVAAVDEARAQGNCGIAGIHIEGPFFTAARRGAHRADMIRAPLAEDIDWLCSLRELTVILTLAPEQLEPGQIRQLSKAGIMVCAGHTDATYEQLRTAAAAGLQGITHLFNAMSPLTSRAPGTVGAALDDDALWLGIIADGHHVHPAAIRLTHRTKPPGRMVLVSDAMATVGSDRDWFELYGETIVKRDGKLVNADGALAGSAIGMIDAVRYAATTVGLPLEECLRMASLYPATILKRQDSLGRIASGYRADLTHFDDDLVVRNTWLAGQHLFTATSAESADAH
jgi:N-acetylglucosamine-6-phosphate deacetylase